MNNTIAWRLLKTCSRIRPAWRAQVKQFENLVREDHYYSPIPRIDDVIRGQDELFRRDAGEIPGIDLRDDEQLAMLERIATSGIEASLPWQKTGGWRYCCDNKFYPIADAVFYGAVMRIARPRRIVEIGSGFSSALCLDIRDRFLDQPVECVFVEPDTIRLDRLLSEDDRRTTRVIAAPVQGVSLDEFRRLEAGDILFVDSSHVCKIGSDVNHILFEILPLLAPGVLVHFHDIFYPFQYPKEWIYRGVAWNEAYALRAFLQFNHAFEIVVWNDYLAARHADRLKKVLPSCDKNSGSLWLRKGSA